MSGSSPEQPTGALSSDAVTVHDAVLDGYREWLNDLLFANKGEGDVVVWVGDGRWALLSGEGPEIFQVEIKRARLEVAQ